MAIGEETLLIVESTANKSAEEAVKRLLLTLGVDHNNPLEVQKDFAVLREMRMLLTDAEFQQDLAHLRRFRKIMDKAQNKGFIASMWFMFLGVAGFIIYGISIKFGLGG